MHKFRYNQISDATISIDITNSYSIIGMAKYAGENNYTVTLYIKRHDVGMLDILEDLVVENFSSTRQTLKHDLAEHIADLYDKNIFRRYIDRYEYMMKCFDIGNNFLGDGGSE